MVYKHGPVAVQNATGLRGVQKPGNASQPHIDIAAHEKIAADLAHYLGLPVPPVTLCDRGPSVPEPRYVAVSAWARGDVLQWQTGEAGLTAEQRIALCASASAMLPFEAWISAQDRQNAGNVLVAADEDGTVFGYWIDYSFSMGYTWNGNVQPNCHIQALYPPVGPIVDAEVADVAARIVAITDATIEQIVNRIPPEYLASDKAKVIIENLKSRRAALAALSNMGVAS